jgi:hypothetical protein
MAVNVRFLRRTNLPPLPPDAPIDSIAQWLAREIELRGHLQHQTTIFSVWSKFGPEFTYTETVNDKRGSDSHLPDWYFLPLLGIRQRHLLRPEILWALLKLTGKKIHWERECRGWRLVKGAKLNLPKATDDDKLHGPFAPWWLAENAKLPNTHGHLPGSFAATSNAVFTAQNPFVCSALPLCLAWENPFRLQRAPAMPGHGMGSTMTNLTDQSPPPPLSAALSG